MRIAYLTAGAAGMYCGSCLHDNALAKAMIKLGHEAWLIPTYTPILTDEEDASTQQLFLGGVNVYLQQMSPIFRWLPRWSDSLLSSPKLVRWVASRAMGTAPKNLGALTVSMLKGMHGKQRKEVMRLCDWLQTQSPDVVVFSNLLIAGCIPALKERLNCPVVVVLQGDDIFYDGLPEPFREQSLQELRRLAKDVDRFVVHTRDYGQRMQEMLEFDERRLFINPLSIDPADLAEIDAHRRPNQPPTIGYLARIAPEKGLHALVDAFCELAVEMPEVRLAIAGWLGAQFEPYWAEQQKKLHDAGLDDRYRYYGAVDRKGKLEFLNDIDLLCVPTPYLEPKGLFILEALAAGVPYVQPAHGAFPEIHERLAGGVLYAPEESGALVSALSAALSETQELQRMGQAGRKAVLDLATTDHEAVRFLAMLNELVDAKE